MGVDRRYAIQLASDVIRKVYEKAGVLPNFIARVLTRDPNKRLRIAARLFKGYPFNTPGYIYERVSSNDGMVFEIFRCPVAKYFAGQDAADLCVSAWCSQAYGLAEMWGGQLEQTRTLAGGHDRCDFHFKVTPGFDVAPSQTGVKVV
jgi:ubiquinone biosynthesis protein